jgi:uncharacterized membrane protein
MADSAVPKAVSGDLAWLSRHYMLIINVVLAIFILFSIAAPVFMKIGWSQAGRQVYHVYSNFCHQFAFRSWFLFGEQAYYQKTSVNETFSYQQVFGVPADDLFAARSIIGNEITGYKMAICQRDFAMYSMLLAAGMIFSFQKRKTKRIPLWIWLLFGVLPLALDGITQLNSTYFRWISWLAVRESTPLLRTVTGGLFGFFSGWYIFTSVERTAWVRQFKDIQFI